MKQCMVEFLDAVCSRVKWKKAHSVIRKELGDHMTDQYDVYIEADVAEDEAARRAVASMGDADVIGAELNRAYRPKIDMGLLIMVGCMLLFGIVGQVLFTTVVGMEAAGSQPYLGMILGVGVMALCAVLNVQQITKRPWMWFLGFLVAFGMILTFGSAWNNRTIYIPYSPFHTVYWGMLTPVFWAAVIHGMRDRGVVGVLMSGVAYLVPCAMALMIPSTALFFVLAITGLVLLFYAIGAGWFGKKRLVYTLVVLVPTLIVILVGGLLLLGRESVQLRLLYMVFPQLDAAGQGYVGTVLRELLGGNAVESIESLGNLLVSYKLTTVIYGYGWAILLGALAVLLGCGYCFTTMLRKQRTMFGKLLTLTCLMLFSLQSVFALLSNFGVVFTADFTLPFLGGNYTWLYNLLLVGMLMSLSRHSCLTAEEPSSSRAPMCRRLFEVEDGKLIIYFK